MSSRSRAFPDEVVSAVRDHLNADHADDLVLLCRTVGRVPGTTQASVVDVDDLGLDLEVHVDGVAGTVRLAFLDRAEDRAAIRREVVRLHELAQAAQVGG